MGATSPKSTIKSKTEQTATQSPTHNQPTIMKPLSYSLIAAAISCGFASGQTAYTVPVGYVTLGTPTGIPANTDVNVSIPLLRSAEYAGVVDSVPAANQLKIAGTPAFGDWTVTPHVLVIENGAKSGVIVPITTNTADTLTLDMGVFSLTGVNPADKVSIRPAWTVSSFMAGASSLVGVQLFTFSNTQEDINNSADGIYVYAGGAWENADGDPADNDVLYPGDGLIVRTTSTAITSFVTTGEVPLCKSYVALGTSATVARDTMFGYFSPVGETLADSGLGLASGDLLLAFDNNDASQNKSGTPYVYLGGGAWENADGDPAGTVLLEGGKSYVFRSNTPGVTDYTMWQDEQSYVPSL
jgi:uncharacterized protein (TIGR02597 family)